ncbi:AurF N-oxygenase family protein [Nocardioides aurantiacus]|uniref:Para-aminobenzoate N-oxygenase AurF n=1 Tax=Nocardioides aurantiacus TaxID=86796 RepID=A0A3N2CWP1_9ACTN|nr:diiron oxygenase [Nocardioides aurantiacus]ROR91972.1 para-aminobenzoate N-oxygenase AurF [Nocardioides aurantiacus]
MSLSVPERLLKSSARHSYDPEVDIDWDAPIDPTLWGMQPERTSLYGTELWEGLTQEQRITLSNHEVASIASVGLWFELILMQMMLRDAYDDDPTAAHMHYALTEVADECRHSTMFGKSIAHLGVPAYGPPTSVHRLGRLFNAVVRGPSAYASILVAEEILDTWQREVMKDERVQPVTRMVARIHVLEEARHMTFARDEVRRQVAGLSGLALLKQQVLTAQTCFMVARSLVNPEVYRSVGIDPRVGRRAALGNPHYRATMQWMGEKPLAFLRSTDLLPAHQEKTWRGSLLLG